MRRRLGWPQHRMAEHLRISQAAVSQMEAKGSESGPISLLLDQLEATELPPLVDADSPSSTTPGER